jgi:chitin disaccharide deacetylase
MSGGKSRRRLIVNADDFGRSASINEAVAIAHREGILTTASLMVNEPSCAEAVQIARNNQRLGVGLHLTLLCGRAALTRDHAPGLVNSRGEFTSSPVLAGMSYFFRPSLRRHLRAESDEQFRRFAETGLPLDHVNGHLHMHLHPVVFSIVTDPGCQRGFTAMRLTRDPLRLNLSVARGKLLYRLVHAIIFGALAARARPHLRQTGVRHTSAVFGLLQNGRVDEEFILRLLPRLPPGDSELYSHPCVRDFKPEFEALISPRVRAEAARAGIELIRYQDL